MALNSKSLGAQASGQTETEPRENMSDTAIKLKAAINFDLGGKPIKKGSTYEVKTQTEAMEHRQRGFAEPEGKKPATKQAANAE